VSASTATALGLAVVSTTLVNFAYLREHDAAAGLPALSMRRPLWSLRTLLGDRNWLVGFATETVGWLLYAAALSLGSLALVQSVAAGGIGVLAWASARFSRRAIGARQRVGVALSMAGLLALGVSLIGGGTTDGAGSTAPIVVWLVATCALGVAAIGLRRRIGTGVAYATSAGLFFSVGDIATKVATQGGTRALFALGLIVGYTLGTSLLQLGYQNGSALTIAGIATLLTNALPIAAGTVLLHEDVPDGVLGAARVLAYVAVIVGAILLARPEAQSASAAARVSAASSPNR
jgi:hypothetical protein